MASSDVSSFWGVHITPLTLAITVAITLAPVIIVLVLAITQGDNTLPAPTGCHKLGLKGRSNLEDQYSKLYARGGDPTPSNPWTVKALFTYPVKSCRGIELSHSEVVHTGLKYDRQFTFAQYVTSLPSSDGKVTSEWQFMTLRKFPRLAKVETEIWIPNSSGIDYNGNEEWVQSEGCLIVRFPFSPDTDFTLEGLRNYTKVLVAKLAGKSEPMLEFRVPFNPSKEYIKSKSYKSEVLRIWTDSPEALNVGSEVDPEIMVMLKYTLGMSNPLTLFRIDTSKYRRLETNAPKDVEAIVGMPDSHPIHILNLASIHDIASHLPREPPPFNMRTPLLNALRFRANIYITGPPAFAEDHWTKARIASPTQSNSTSTTYHISCRTTRCKLPNVDPETGIADRNEPLTTMRKYRIIDEGSKNACLGMQVTPLEEGVVSVGDGVEVLETGEHRFDGAGGGVNIQG